MRFQPIKVVCCTTAIVNDTILEDGGFLDQDIDSRKPWLVVEAPVAPHVQTGGGWATRRIYKPAAS